MNYTQHIQLPQLVETDRLMMSDFNDMTQKIDEGMGTLDARITAAPYAKIKTLTVATAAATVNLDVSDVDFSQYLKVELFFQCAQSISVNIRTNGLTSGYRSIALSGGGSRDPGDADYLASFRGYGYGMLQFYAPNSLGKVGCINITYDGSTSYAGYQLIAPCTWGELNTFNFAASSGKIPAGTYIGLFGVQK